MAGRLNYEKKLMKIDIIIPVYNEGLFIDAFLHDLFQQKKAMAKIQQVIIVDDGSIDNTGKVLQKLKSSKIKILTHKKNRGKGAAMRTGLRFCKNNKSDAVIFMDGDRQHNPKHLIEFVLALEKHRLIFGYRRLDRTAPYFRKLGNTLVRKLFRRLFNIKRHDILCGFMAIRSELFNELNWQSDDYGVEPEISAIVGTKKISFKELLIETLYLDSKKGVTLLKAFFIFLKIPYWYFKYS